MSAATTIEVELAGGVRWLYLNRPERRNAIDDRLIAELDEAVAGAAEDDDTDVVVIAGRGPSFCAGADLRHLLAVAGVPGGPTRFLSRVSATIGRLESCPKPVVAALHGHAVAGGLEIALACDVVVAAEGTLIGDGHLRNRLLPAGGSSVRLPRKVGAGLARHLMLTGQLIPARSFLGSGWIQAVVARDEVQAAASKAAADLAAVAGPAQRNMKGLMNAVEGLPPADALEVELRQFGLNWRDADVVAALESFLAARA